MRVDFSVPDGAFASLKDDRVSSRPSVVVVIPYYNGSRWIERAVKSAINQTVMPDEIIVVNDGSTPPERAALIPLAKKYGFIMSDKTNGGQGSARNFGVKATKSDYICFLDQDDYYLPHHIEDLIGMIPQNDRRFGFAYADLCHGDENGMIVQSNLLRTIQHVAHPKQGHVATLLRFDLFILPSASIIRREAFNEIGGFDPQFMGYEDDDLFLRMFRAGYTNYYLDKPVTVWCMHGESTSNTIRMSRSRFRYFRKLAENFPDQPKINVFYMNHSLIPRFEKDFITEATDGSSKSAEDARERVEILAGFSEIVTANTTVSEDYKKHVHRMLAIAKREPIAPQNYGTFQKLLHESYNSTSWRMTRRLRTIKRRLRGIPYTPERIPQEEDRAQALYERVVRSLSWRITAPVRFISKVATRR